MSSEWQSYQLGALFELVNGFAFKGGDFKSSGIPVIKIKNVKPNKLLLSDLAFVDSDVADKRPDKELKRGDILITMSGNRMDGSRDTWVGKVAYFDIPGRYMLNQRVGVLRPKEGVEVDRRCCSYFLSSDGFQDFFIAVATSSGGQANLSPSQILGEKINLPPLAEQKLIASLLTALDDRIALLRDSSASLEAIAQVLFKSWFVDFDPVRAKMEGRSPEGMDEATSALFPNSFEESELGLVPKGWSVGTVEDICQTITNGGTPSRSNKAYWVGGEVPWFKTGDFSDGFLLSPTERITQAALECSAAKLLPENAVLMAIYAAPTVGRLGVLTEPATFNQACTGMVAHKNIGPWFLYWTLYFGRDWFNSRANGAAQQNISKAIVSGYKVVIPSDAALAAFNDVVAPIQNRIRANSEQAKELGDLRDTLLPRLISGKLRLPLDLK